ncbi:GT2 family glycosyltransferase [Leeuwenhoekiella aestuarii]|uniref:GT2 family glycosyltransferase n=1 Tax=Leeuwenhoekiella aestuarii TaxID=2249426 RepID=A0A4Q0NPU9_9FLAO|nr:glycosyltransferase [Leeuwenhoekiella aestuarii]RXG12320.1 GT2 family glycosyltransferase [Leeuwenhoekiella aestuarii]RXG13753.1 GT2 family glycosyltransferase [Leeuwenhoekiella aestuarii]
MTRYITDTGEILLYTGTPDLKMLDQLAKGPGDLWHSSYDQGFKNCFPELVYQTATFWWFINDFENTTQCVNWRVNPDHFVIREQVWDFLKGFDESFKNQAISGIELGYRLLREAGGVPLYVKGLFPSVVSTIEISALERYIFYRKHFKVGHSLYMLVRQPISAWLSELINLLKAKQHVRLIRSTKYLPLKALKSFQDVKVSVVIPTMFRQEYTVKLLKDYAAQSVLPLEVIVVDATPVANRDATVYELDLPYRFQLIWQETSGSCRARNEAIMKCKGDYIIFGDDDIRIPSNFIENHIRFLETYKADACNGRDVRAKHYTNDLNDLEAYLRSNPIGTQKSGVAHQFSNANSCVRMSFVRKLIGNDVNFDGGYGEDSDFGLRLLKAGAIVLYNPFSVNLHLKPPAGGYRFWGQEEPTSKPWELDAPVGALQPVPSPTIMYYTLKHFTPSQQKEYKYKHFILNLVRGKSYLVLKRLLHIPKKLRQYRLSKWYAQRLIALGERYK